MPRTVDATITELQRSALAGRPAKTIFFGGGTPTFLDASDLSRLLRAVTETHPPIAGCEITTESNPGTADADKYRTAFDAGFNRISLGAQSFKSQDLLRLGRVHQSEDIGNAVSLAREAGFKNLNLDLMFALPGQSTFAWQDNLQRAIELDPDHISLYCLTLEPNTAFYKEHLKGQLILPPEEDQVEMYEVAVATSTRAGYIQYEISNFAKLDMECRHNLCYWKCEEYAAYGPGAVSCIESVRETRLKHPERYCEALESSKPFLCEEDALSDESKSLEKLMLGLRLNEGLTAPEALLRCKAVQDLCAFGWIEAERNTIRLTPLGRHFCSEATLKLAQDWHTCSLF